MSITYVSAALRRLIRARADSLCEYCLIHEEDTYFGCEVDHVIAEKHGGATSADNLALACAFCNRAKGTDIGSRVSGHFVPLFNPRTDCWSEHFALDDELSIQPRTAVGTATVRVLALNRSERILERQVLAEQGRYPSDAARLRLSRHG